MNREFLKELNLTDEQVNTIMAEYGKTYNPLKQQLDDLQGEKLALQTQVDERDTQIKELSNQAEKGSDLAKQLEDYRKENEEAKLKYEQELQMVKLNHALETKLLQANVYNPKTVEVLLDKDVIKLQDDKLIGVDEQLETIKTDHAYLFKQEPTPAIETSTGQHTTPPQHDEVKPSFDNMQELIQLKNTNPDEYNRLMGK